MARDQQMLKKHAGDDAWKNVRIIAILEAQPQDTEAVNERTAMRGWNKSEIYWKSENNKELWEEWNFS